METKFIQNLIILTDCYKLRPSGVETSVTERVSKLLKNVQISVCIRYNLWHENIVKLRSNIRENIFFIYFFDLLDVI